MLFHLENLEHEIYVIFFSLRIVYVVLRDIAFPPGKTWNLRLTILFGLIFVVCETVFFAKLAVVRIAKHGDSSWLHINLIE